MYHNLMNKGLMITKTIPPKADEERRLVKTIVN